MFLMAKGQLFTLKTIAGEVLNEDLGGTGLGIAVSGHKMTVYKRLQEGERFIGGGEELGALDRRGQILTLRNTDYFRYDDPRIPMHVSIPFFTGLHHGRIYGLFFNNSHRSVLNFGSSNRRFASFSFDGGPIDEFYFGGPTVRDVLAQYSEITGRMPLPPKWSLGYQQSRASYFPDSQVKLIADTFRHKHIPIDGITLDADYLWEYQPFRIHPQRFPDMKGLVQQLDAMRIEVTASINPTIAMDPSYSVFKSGQAGNMFLRYQDGEPYTVDMAPNVIELPDFSSPRVRDWWIGYMQLYADLGIHGYWNDMNEPAIEGQAMPDNVVFDFDGQKTSPLEAHNTFGSLVARTSYEAGERNDPTRRPFVLVRAGFAGVQRYAAVWTGDNQAKDEHILLGVHLTNQLGLSGVPFTGADVGGYLGDGNGALYRRWIEVAAFAPYVRSHREQFAAANEPWAYGEEAEGLAKAYIGLRYRLMPYLYSAFREANETGLPIARSLAIDAPFEASVYATKFQYEFLCGPALLINPMTSKETSKTTYLPAGIWYDFFNDTPHPGGTTVTEDYPLTKLPVFVKGSSIIPMQALVTPVTFKLRLLVTWMTATAANLLTINVTRVGTQLMSPDGSFQYDVAAACSGMRSLVAIFLLATVYGFVLFRSPGKRAFMMALALPLSVLGNFTRLMCIIFAAEMGGQSMGNFVHENWFFSLLPYIPAFAGLWLAGRWLEKKSETENA
jgi:alpha-glucosidase